MAAGVNFLNGAVAPGSGYNYLNAGESYHSVKDWLWRSNRYVGEVQTSPDGVNWTAQSSFIVKIVNWSQRTSGNQTIFDNLNGVAYGNGTFVVVGDAGTIISAVAQAPAPASSSSQTGVSQTTAPASPSSGGQQAVSFIIGQSSYSMGGTSYPMDGAPLITNGRALVPVRYLADALGAQTAWDASAQQVTVTKGGTTLELVIGSTAINTNGTVSQMDVAPVVENGRTYLPARYIAEAFGDTVSWDAAAQTISIAG
jgi:hypothetical protein